MSEIRKNIFECRYPANLYRIRKNEGSGITYGGVLIHYGIKGQKWGLRRFQNEDRTLTEEGKARYNKDSREERKARKAERKAAREAAKPESSKWKSKEAAFLSDEELNRRNNRLQREQQYRSLTKSNGRKFLEGVGKAVNKILIGSLIGATAGFVGKNYKTILNNGADFINNNDFMGIKLAKLS